VKPKTTVRLKVGTLGLNEPENLGVVLALKKAGKKRLVKVATIKGKATLGRERIKAGKFPNYQGELSDDKDIKEHLRQTARASPSTTASKGPGQAKVQLTERELWERVHRHSLQQDSKSKEEPPNLSLTNLAAIWFDSPSPSGAQVNELQTALQEWRQRGFELFGPHGRGFVPLTADQQKANRRQAQELKELIGVFRQARGLAEEELEEQEEAGENEAGGDDGKDRKDRKDEKEQEEDQRRATFAFPLKEVALSPDQEELVRRLCPLMAAHVQEGHWPDHGPFGQGLALAAGFDWRTGLERLAKLQSGSRYTTDATAKFLLWQGHWEPLQAIAALTERHGGSELFPFDLDYPGYLVGHTDRLPESIDDETIKDRTDLRHLTCYTIDPPTARDFDDAIGLESEAEGLKEGQTALWVHIADVSHYVEPETELDQEAYRRATSVYLPDRVLPMLPPRLSDDLCSLRARVDRLAMSVRLVVDEAGQVVDAQPCDSVIRVTENLAYDEALERAHAGDPHLTPLFELARLMRVPRQRLEVESKERKIHLDPDLIRLEWKEPTEATEAIETFMVAANEAVADWLTGRKVPLPYRCHDRPGRSAIEELNETLRLAQLDLEVDLDWEAIERLREELEQTGSKTDGTDEEGGDLGATLAEMATTFGGNISLKLPEGMEQLLGDSDEADGETGKSEADLYPSETELALAELYRQGLNRTLNHLYSHLPADLVPVVLGRVLRTAGEAYYTTSNTGHFGLGSRGYCHFTSPIRRYPDLLVHRQLKAALKDDGPPHSLEELAEMTDHCSQRSRQAAAFEYQIIDICLALLGHLEGLVGHTISGRVSGLIPARVFLQLENGCEGALSTRSLGANLEVDASGALLLGPDRAMTDKMSHLPSGREHEMEGPLTEAVLRLGQKLTLRVVGTDLLEGRLEVILVK